MADSEIDKVLATLNASFEAAVARQEDEAASDLAFSLLQDLDFFETVRRGPGAVLRMPGGNSFRVVEAGTDYVVAEGAVRVLVPTLHAVVIRATSGDPPRAVRGTMLDALRRMARAHTKMEVVTQDMSLDGRLVKAGPDHVVLQVRGSNVLVGLGALRAVKVAREGSADAS
jgi:hypothetical protein